MEDPRQRNDGEDFRNDVGRLFELDDDEEEDKGSDEEED